MDTYHNSPWSWCARRAQGNGAAGWLATRATPRAASPCSGAHPPLRRLWRAPHRFRWPRCLRARLSTGWPASGRPRSYLQTSILLFHNLSNALVKDHNYLRSKRCSRWLLRHIWWHTLNIHLLSHLQPIPTTFNHKTSHTCPALALERWEQLRFNAWFYKEIYCIPDRMMLYRFGRYDLNYFLYLITR